MQGVETFNRFDNFNKKYNPAGTEKTYFLCKTLFFIETYQRKT